MSYRLGYIAEYLEAELVSASSVSDADEIEITGISSPSLALGNQVSFVVSKAYLSDLELTNAAAIILKEEFAELCPVSYLLAKDPYLAYAKLTALFAEPTPSPNIEPTAVVAESACIGSGCYIAASAVVGEDAVIGENTYVGPNVSIGARAKIGARGHLYPNVSIYHDVVIGTDTIIHSGAVIGSDGFGFAPSAQGYVKIHQLGSVIIGDRVEIGANTSIDRGALGNTEIHDGVKIDNLVHIAHNCIVGINTAMAAQVGLAGTTELGKGCTVGGQVGIAGHLKITDSVHFTGKTMVTKGISEPGLYSSGTGFSDNNSWRKNAVRFKQLDEIYRRLLRLERDTANKD